MIGPFFLHEACRRSVAATLSCGGLGHAGHNRGRLARTPHGTPAPAINCTDVGVVAINCMTSGEAPPRTCSGGITLRYVRCLCDTRSARIRRTVSQVMTIPRYRRARPRLSALNGPGHPLSQLIANRYIARPTSLGQKRLVNSAEPDVESQSSAMQRTRLSEEFLHQADNEEWA